MENATAEWPVIELHPPKSGILSQFSPGAGESVANVLVRELVERVDRPSSTAGLNSFTTDQEVEWIMQVVNHALSLPFNSNQCYETLRSAVRVYLAWASALTAFPHHSCPKQLLAHPDRYFRKILEAFRPIFQDKTQNSQLAVDLHLFLSRQGTQIRNILTAVRHLATEVVDDFKDELWSRTLLFLINTTDQLLSVEQSKAQDSIGSLMASDLCQSLFECWLQAAFSEFIPSPSYWRTLSALSSRCILHVPFVECWARSLLRVTASLLRQLYGQEELPNVQIEGRVFFDQFPPIHSVPSPERTLILKGVWLSLFTLLGNPATFTRHMLEQLEHKTLKASDLAHFAEQTSLSFFLAVLAFKKMVDMFYGDPSVSTDFSESDELHSQWLEAILEGRTESLQDQQEKQVPPQRVSNMSSASHSMPTTPAPTAGSTHVQLPRKSVAVVGDSSFPTTASTAELVAVQMQLNAGKVRAEQQVWFILRNNEFKRFPRLGPNGSMHPLSGPLLSVFLQWLAEPTLFQLAEQHSQRREADAQSQAEDTSSHLAEQTGAPEKHRPLQRPQVTAAAQQRTAATDSAASLRRSFATTVSASTATSCGTASYCSDPTMLGAPHHQFSSPTEFPSVDGLAAGRSTALSTLCRIVCTKTSREKLGDEQLAQFFAILHEALISRDRLMLCALIYHTADELFKLALNGVQILLPNYLMAIDIVYTESMKLRLHPSVSQVEMRAACLRALASILAWPSVFGSSLILRRKMSQSYGSSAQLRRPSRGAGSSTNLLEAEPSFTDLLPRMQRVLVHSLRNEPEPSNVQTALALCAQLCAESSSYDLDGKRYDENTENRDGKEEQAPEEKVPFSVSLVRAVVSAICDKLCKPSTGWAGDTMCCLAAFDCLNTLSSLSHRTLFHNGELSTGSLIVSSLCRFIDQQLQKPPPHHSRDMHSTVVAAYFCMNVWLNAAPALSEIETCLSTVAQTIELGMTGGRQLSQDQYKPASQRVHDAAELLLHSLFTNSGASAVANNCWTAADEFALAKKFGLGLTGFQHFLLGESTLLSLHEAQHLPHLSNELPTVIAIFRTPFCEPWASLVQLLPKGKASNGKGQPQQNGHLQQEHGSNSSPSPGCNSLGSQQPNAGNGTVLNGEGGAGKRGSVDTLEEGGRIKQFEVPPEVLLPQCKLDTQFPHLEPGAPNQVRDIQAQLSQIRSRLAQGAGAPIGDRDTRNVWLNSSLGALLTKSPSPESPVASCNSLRVFLHDMGLINRKAFGRAFIPLDNSSHDVFYDSLAQTVDTFPVRLTETVSLFYVRDGQRSAEEILQNNIDLRQTSAHYCRLLSQLGKAVARRQHYPRNSTPAPNHAVATSARCNAGTAVAPCQQDSSSQQPAGYVLDGLDHFLRWRDPQVEVAFLTPTGRFQTTGGFVPSSPNSTALLQQQQRKTSTGVAEHQQQQQSVGKSLSVFVDAHRMAPNSSTPTTTRLEHFDSREGLAASRDEPMLRELDRARGELLWAQSVELIAQMESEFARMHDRGTKVEFGLEAARIEEEDEHSGLEEDGVPACRATIITLPTEESGGEQQNAMPATMSFLMATRVVVKSARFKRKQEAALLRQHSSRLDEEEDEERCQERKEMARERSFPSRAPPPVEPVVMPSQQEMLAKDAIRRLSYIEAVSHSAFVDSDERGRRVSRETNGLARIDLSAAARDELRFVDTTPPASPAPYFSSTRKSSVLPERRDSGRSECCSSSTSPLSVDTSASGPMPPAPPPSNVSTVPWLKSLFRRTSKSTLLVAGVENHGGRLGMGRRGSKMGEWFGGGGDERKEPSPLLNCEAASSFEGDAHSRRESVAILSAPLPKEAEQMDAARRDRTKSCLSADGSACSFDTTTTAKTMPKRSSDQRIFVVWLERWEDADAFPVEEMFQFTPSGTTFICSSSSSPIDQQQQQQSAGQSLRSSTAPYSVPVDPLVLFLFPLESGIVRVRVAGVWTKYGQPGPLFNGTVVSEGELAALLRQTVCNVARRKAVELDNYQMTHLRRRHAIAEFGRRFAGRESYTEFVAQLLSANI